MDFQQRHGLAVWIYSIVLQHGYGHAACMEMDTEHGHLLAA
jgi:hypothetical protein